MENMENIITFENIGEVALLIKRAEINTECLNYFMPIKEAHENSFGGCSCNRKNRINRAIEIYKKTVVESPDDIIQKLKISLNVDQIKFKQDNIEFAKF